MTKEISNTNDVIDTRDLIARIEELEQELSFDYWEDEIVAHFSWSESEKENATEETKADALKAWLDHKQMQDELEELTKLKAFASEVEGYCDDYIHGEALIHEDYFEEYARQLAEDIGAISKDAAWPNNHIDWEAAAEALKMDYTTAEFDGATYYFR